MTWGLIGYIVLLAVWAEALICFLASGVSLGRNMFWAYWRKAHMFFVIIALIVFFAWKGAELPVWGMQAF